MAELSFEKALEELENTVAKLEKGDLSLDDSLSFFEKGVQLAKFLRSELEKAEKKIEVLLKEAESKVKAKPFELKEEKEDLPEEETPDSSNNKDILL